MGCSTKCCSIENGGCMSEARSRQVGPPGADWCASGLRSLIIDPGKFSGSGGWDKEKSYEELNQLEKRADRWQHGRNEHMLPIRSRKDHALCLSSCLTPAETGHNSRGSLISYRRKEGKGVSTVSTHAISTFELACACK